MLAALLPEPGNGSLDGGGLLGHGEQRAGALHNLAAACCGGCDPLGGGGCGERGLHPVAAEHADWFGVADRFGVADDGHVDDPHEQGSLRAEAHVDRARADLGAFGYSLEHGGQVPAGEEQLGRASVKITQVGGR